MQRIYDLNISIEEYIANQKSNNYPIFTECPHCHDRLVKNGFYRRYVITTQGTYIIYIRRYRCKTLWTDYLHTAIISASTFSEESSLYL
ncbi:MAG: transposase family protein [Firmicutes bacterium]|nr:transposase family protein [Bacillota bacterium]